MSHNVAQVARIAGISGTSARVWSRKLAAVMSAGANPPAGQERRYSDDDAAILATARVMRADGRPWEEVIATIRAGDRIVPEAEPPAPVGPDSQLVALDWWDRVTSLHRAEVDRLQLQLTEAQDARIEAEREAARLAGILEAITETTTAAAERRPPRWQFWRK